MTLFFADLVREFSYGAGAGPLPLGGAVPGHRAFADAVPEGARFLYAIAGVTRADEWETGEGEVADGLLVRSPASSSAGGGAVDFLPGLKTVALTATAAWYAGQEARGGPVAIHDVEGLAAALSGKAAVGHGHDGAYQPLDAELSALAGLSGQTDRAPYFTGPGAAALMPVTGFGRSLIDDADATAARVTLGLGSAATEAVGTNGSKVAKLDGTNTWAATQTVSAPNVPLWVNSSNGNFNKIAMMDFGSAVVFFGGSGEVPFQVQRASAPYTNYFSIDGSGVATFSGELVLGGDLRRGATRLVGSRRTGWSAPTGTATRTGFDSASVTTAQLAERVKALIDDLIAHGLIGA
jgi:hypothetical protein